MRRIIACTAEGPIGPEQWDRLVAADPRGHLLQTWAWGQLKGEFGWAPERLAVERDGALLAGAQVLYRRVGPLRIAYIPKGPVWVEDDEPLVTALWQAIHRQARRRGAILLKVEPEWREDEAPPAWLGGQGWRPSRECIQPRRTIWVDLQATEEEILARMKPKWRYNIRLAERKGVQVREGRAAEVGIFYALLQITGRRDGFGIHRPEYYRRAWELFAPQERVKLYLASYQGEPLAGLMAYCFNRQAWYMYGASSDVHRELMPNHGLQWRAMQWAKAQGCIRYDLWGISDVDPRSPAAALGGVQRFKEGFGGEVVRYVGAYDYPYSRPLYALLERLWAARQRRGGRARSSSA